MTAKANVLTLNPMWRFTTEKLTWRWESVDGLFVDNGTGVDELSGSISRVQKANLSVKTVNPFSTTKCHYNFLPG